MQKRLTWRYVLVGALACAALVACGDDDDAGDGGTSGKDGGAATGGGGSGGSKAGSGGSGGKGGAGGSAGKSGSGGGGGTGGAAGMQSAACSEPAPTGPVTCGGQTCMAPTFENNPCVVPCCVQQNGAEVCGAKSTNPMFPAECSVPATPDSNCPDLDGMGMPFKGCCNAAMGKCGFISTARPGCILQSMVVTLPDPLMSCTPGGGDDAGTEDAGL